MTGWTSNCITMLWGIAGYSLLRWHGNPNINTVFITPGKPHHRQPDSKQSQINFKLAAQSSIFITMLWGRAGYPLLRPHSSPSVKNHISIDVVVLSIQARWQTISEFAAQAKCIITFITILWGRAGYPFLRSHGNSSIKIRISIDVAILSQPARWQTISEFTAQAKCISTFVTMLWGIAEYYLLRWHGSPR